MNQQRRIADELRQYASYAATDRFRQSMLDIADRIDAEHEEAIASVMNDALYHANDKGMADFGWVRLPKDADGEVIHVGDVMEPKGSVLLFGETSFEVRSMRCNEYGWEVYDRLGDSHAPSLLRHYHAPTVEDVLRDMHAKLDEVTALYVGEAIDSDERDSDEARIFAEYAAKLQLRGDAE